MDSPEPVVKRRRRTKQPKKKSRFPFFQRRLKNRHITYFEVTVFIVFIIILLLVLFRIVIINYIYEYFELL